MRRHVLSQSALLLALIVVSACRGDSSSSVDSVDATAALPEPGTMPGDFSYPAVIGPPVTKEMLKRRPTVLALWSWRTPGHVVPMREFDSLTMRFAMPGYLRFVVIADQEKGPTLDSAVQAAPWASRVESVGAGAGNIPIIFDQSLRVAAQKRGGARVQFRMPSFLLLDENARVVRRVAGRPYAVLAPALDSIKTLHEVVASRDDSALVRDMRPRIDALLKTFDPSTLTSADTSVRLDGTCGEEETIPAGLILAKGRVLELKMVRPSLYAITELTSVAFAEPDGAKDICGARRIKVTPGIRVDTLEISFGTYGVRDSSVAWIASGSVRPNLNDGSRKYALIGLDATHHTLLLPPGTSVQQLRARIDSVRRAR